MRVLCSGGDDEPEQEKRMGGEGEEPPPPPLNWAVGALAPGSGAKSGGGCRRRRERAGEREVCVCLG
jgi:hypothetical protein